MLLYTLDNCRQENVTVIVSPRYGAPLRRKLEALPLAVPGQPEAVASIYAVACFEILAAY